MIEEEKNHIGSSGGLTYIRSPYKEIAQDHDKIEVSKFDPDMTARKSDRSDVSLL